ncbi:MULTISPECIES: AbfB domain-containing protein [Micrococcaceae]|uniref:AbfB domain-containing protein n=1 Tax=Micrococcaceae TaxID=1268 RepID=UPI0009E89A08
MHQTLIAVLNSNWARVSPTDTLADATASSYQSYNFPDRYLRHADFRLRIDPITSNTSRSDATFRNVR